MATWPLVTSRTGGVVTRAPLASLLMAASGFAGLGYQIVWTEQGALWLGHEAAAVLAVVAAFFGGLAVGAFGLGARIERSTRPVRWYAACELAIAAWGVVLVLAMPAATDRLLAAIGTDPGPAWHWTVAFAGTFVLLLPATAAMGATLPAIERIVARVSSGGRSIAGLYASNTLGAVLGVLATAFWLIPALGLSTTTLVCVALNLACAVGAGWLGKPTPTGPAPVPRAAADGTRVQAALFVTGLLGIGYEVLVVRVLSQVCEDTVYTFALLLAVYLSGTAAGAGAYQRAVAGRGAGDGVAERLSTGLAIACLLGVGSLWFADALRTVLLESWNGGPAAALAVEAALAVAAFGLPTVVMGALFSHLAARAHAAGVPFGRAIGINVAGAAVAPLVLGVWLASVAGPKAALLVVIAGYLVLAGRWRTPRPLVLAAAAAVIALVFAPPLAFIDVPDGGRVVSYRDGTMAAVSVVEDADGVARLRIDNREQEGSSASRYVDARQALLPILLHPAPRRALFLGLGTGVTAASAAEDRDLAVDAVELLPDVIEASHRFTREFGDGTASRLHPIAADARRFVRTGTLAYDVVVADNFHPARGGSGALYTVEHFAAVRGRLAEGGLFCQWLPLHQLDLETLRSVVKSFVTVYPGGWAVLASNSLGTPVVGLVGNRDGRPFDVAAVRARLADAKLAEGPAEFGFDDEYALLGSFVAGPSSLARFAGDAVANTDDRPLVAYRAPWVTYAPQSAPADRLVALLAAVTVLPGDVVAAPAVEATRLAAYWSARRRFIEIGHDVRPSADVRVMLAGVGEPLLEVLGTSPDFRPAYDPLLRMAAGLARLDPAAAARLLARLAALQPARREARDALARMPVPNR